MPLELFVNKNDEVIVGFAVGADKKDPTTLYCDVSVEKLKEVYDDVDPTTIEEHTATFRRPTFEDVSKLYDNAFSFVGDEMKANASSVRFLKVIRLLKSWTLPKPATAAEVALLSPVVAIIIGSELERLTA